ncbi:MAG: S4 domain-containing protein [Acidimicrobiia bacterium]|nr:S4 domain-containing protein [Acidimicrobiia bacterium]
MAELPDWKQLLDAGVEFTSVTREQAERIAEDLVEEGRLASDRAETFVDDLLERRRRWSEQLSARISDEIQRQLQRQLRQIGIATQDDIHRLEAEIGSSSTTSSKKSAKKKAAGRSRQEAGQEAGEEEVIGQEAGEEEVIGQKAGQEAGEEEDRRQEAGQEVDRAPLTSRTTVRRRLDKELVRRGLVSSRTEGAEAIAAGRVLVGGAPAAKAARLVAAGEPIQLSPGVGSSCRVRGGNSPPPSRSLAST